jgi:ABC-2 type transport system ATP-binding protein
MMGPMTLELRAGEALALIGANGSGKSTMLRVLAGKLLPVGGTAEVFTRPPHRLDRETSAWRYDIIASEQNYDFLTLREQWCWHRAFYSRWCDATARNLAATLAVPCDRSLVQLSKGQKLKARLCCALAARSRLLLLDEPFEGLDRQSREGVKAALSAWLREGDVGLVYSIHREEDAVDLATRTFAVD